MDLGIDTTAALDSVPADAPVVIAGDTLFVLSARLGPFSARERALAIEARIQDLIRNPSLEPLVVRAEADAEAYDIYAGDVLVMTLTPADAQAAGQDITSLARDHATTLRVTLEREIDAFSLTSLLVGALYTILATAVLVLLLRLFARAFPVVYRFIGITLRKRIPSLRFQNLELLSPARVVQVLEAIVVATRVVLTVLLLYFYLPLVLSFFPWTRRLSGQIVGWVVDPVRNVAAAILAYLPNLFTIAVIIVVTYYAIKLVRQFFLAVEHGTITFASFYPEWSRPTYKIVRFLIVALAVIMIWPYLPRSDSEAFKGVAAFLGLLLTFGSASAMANVFGGIIITYMRAFRVGDRVKIADTVGDVVEQTLLVTRVRTIKNVEITIPNSLVLGAHIINWSSTAREGGVLLHTGVTIGYDVPWRQVHELLVAAAGGTEGIIAEPEPFVLQTSLDDFYVSYELNAYTDQPNRMAVIYSLLHQNIQDRFNQAGVEIMSPHYGALRDGNQITIPTEHLPPQYEPTSFRLSGRLKKEE